MPDASPRPYPFVAFNFSVEIHRDGESGPLVGAAFADCDGLEMSMDVKTIREGGDAARAIRLSGNVTYSPLTLKRGMTEDAGLWKWFQDSIDDPRLRADAEVVVLAPDGQTERARFQLARCLPVKLKAPMLSAANSAIAVEELQIAYESMKFVAGRG